MKLQRLSERKKKTLFSAAEVAARWGVCRATVVRAIRAGSIQAVRFSRRGHYLIHAKEVNRIEGNSTANMQLGARP
jgi:excisionase family DNA binding protein